MKKADKELRQRAFRAWVLRIAAEEGYDSPTALARKAGVDPSVMSRHMSGSADYAPSWATVQAIAKVTKIPAPMELQFGAGISTGSTGRLNESLGKLVNHEGAGIPLPEVESMEPLEEMAVRVLERSTTDRAMFLFQTALERKKARDKRKKPVNPS